MIKQILVHKGLDNTLKGETIIEPYSKDSFIGDSGISIKLSQLAISEIYRIVAKDITGNAEPISENVHTLLGGRHDS